MKNREKTLMVYFCMVLGIFYSCQFLYSQEQQTDIDYIKKIYPAYNLTTLNLGEKKEGVNDLFLVYYRGRNWPGKEDIYILVMLIIDKSSLSLTSDIKWWGANIFEKLPIEVVLFSRTDSRIITREKISLENCPMCTADKVNTGREDFLRISDQTFKIGGNQFAFGLNLEFIRYISNGYDLQDNLYLFRLNVHKLDPIIKFVIRSVNADEKHSYVINYSLSFDKKTISGFYNIILTPQSRTDSELKPSIYSWSDKFQEYIPIE
jgi:hypothetical protein